jgi:hypothetical protein
MTSPFIDVTTFPGSDLGAKINAADAHLGTKPGTILVPSGNYTWVTHVLLNKNHNLHLGSGYYTVNATSDTEKLILLKDDTSVFGDGWNTFVEQPHSNSLIGTFADSLNGANDGPANIFIGDFVVVPANSPTAPVSFAEVIVLGNIHDASVSHVKFDNPVGDMVNIGGSSNAGYHASNVWIKECLVNSTTTGIALSAVNAYNFHIESNTFVHLAGLDLEINTESDVLEQFVISNNIFHGSGPLLVQGGKFGNVVNNILDADGVPDLETAITAIGVKFSSDLLIANNIVRNYRASGSVALQSYGSCSNIVISDNKIVDSGRVAAIRLESISDHCTIRNNDIGNPNPQLYSSSNIIEESGCSNNIVYGNRLRLNGDGSTPSINLVGSGSKAWNNIIGSVLV